MGKSEMGKGEITKGEMGKGEITKGDMGKGEMGKNEKGKGEMVKKARWEKAKWEKERWEKANRDVPIRATRREVREQSLCPPLDCPTSTDQNFCILYDTSLVQISNLHCIVCTFLYIL